MPSPNTTTYERPDIGQAFIEFDAAAAEAGFVGLELAPQFNAAEQGGNFPRVPIEAVLEEVETKRNSKGAYHQSDWEFEQDSYATEEHGAEERIDDRQMKIYAYALDFEIICAARARYKVLSRLERDIRDVAQALGVATAVAVPWSVPQTADPVGDVLTEVDAFKVGCGHLPNAGWLTDKALRKLARCASIKDQIKYSGLDDPKLLTEPTKRSAFLSALAELFGLPRLIVASAVRNAAKKNMAFSGEQVWSDGTFGLIRTATSQDLEEVCAMRTFVWDEDGGGIGGKFETYRNEAVRSEMMRFRHERKVKTLHSVCVRRLTGVVA